MKYRMYILPMPLIEMPMEPTDIEFNSEKEMNDFIENYGVEHYRQKVIEQDHFYGETPEFTFLKVY